MKSLESKLSKRLQDATRIAVMGIGSTLRGDDGVGVLVALALQKLLAKKRRLSHVKALFGETAPENLTGEIKEFAPSHLIIVDAADFGTTPGFTDVIDPTRINTTSFSTHRLPLDIFARYLNQSFSCEVILIGIQLKTMGFGKKTSPQVSRAAQRLAKLLLALIQSKKKTRK